MGTHGNNIRNDITCENVMTLGNKLLRVSPLIKRYVFFETRHPKLMQTEVPVVASLVLLGVVRAHVNHCEP